mmetsp:Transcript_19294/g.49049  ORF Transcript_19294/g.49049 Transcript_19294/m.49049 type:complete len:403 (-) Transcript_19294:169-1377(-)
MVMQVRVHALRDAVRLECGQRLCGQPACQRGLPVRLQHGQHPCQRGGPVRTVLVGAGRGAGAGKARAPHQGSGQVPHLPLLEHGVHLRRQLCHHRACLRARGHTQVYGKGGPPHVRQHVGPRVARHKQAQARVKQAGSHCAARCCRLVRPLRRPAARAARAPPRHVPRGLHGQQGGEQQAARLGHRVREAVRAVGVRAIVEHERVTAHKEVHGPPHLRLECAKQVALLRQPARRWRLCGHRRGSHRRGRRGGKRHECGQQQRAEGHVVDGVVGKGGGRGARGEHRHPVRLYAVRHAPVRALGPELVLHSASHGLHRDICPHKHAAPVGCQHVGKVARPLRAVAPAGIGREQHRAVMRRDGAFGEKVCCLVRQPVQLWRCPRGTARCVRRRPAVRHTHKERHG